MIDPSTATICAALIAAVSAIATAVYAGIRTSKTSKQLAQLQNELSKQKEMALEYMRAYLNLEIEDRNQELAAFKEMIRLVQLLRDQLRRHLEYSEAERPGAAGRDLASLSKEIADCYAENQVLFDDQGANSDRLLVHSLKDECQKVQDLMRKYLKDPQSTLRSSIEKLLASITAKQRELRNRAQMCTTRLLDDMKKRIEQGD
jgi:hypothetical protein